MAIDPRFQLNPQLQEAASQIALKRDFEDPSLIDTVIAVIKDLTGLDLHGLWEGVENLVNGVAHVVNQVVDIITGIIVTPINTAIAAVQDFFTGLFGFQRDTPVQIQSLQDRAQELEGVIGYGNVVMTRNEHIGLLDTRPILKFGGQIGRMKGVTIAPGGDGLVLGSPGLWRADCIIYPDFTNFTGDPWVIMDLEVHYPQGGLYERKRVRSEIGGGQSLVGMLSFTVPDPGYRVHVFVTSGRWRRFLGGTLWSMLSVNKWDTQITPMPPDEVPDGPTNQ